MKKHVLLALLFALVFSGTQGGDSDSGAADVLGIRRILRGTRRPQAEGAQPADTDNAGEAERSSWESGLQQPSSEMEDDDGLGDGEGLPQHERAGGEADAEETAGIETHSEQSPDDWEHGTSSDSDGG